MYQLETIVVIHIVSFVMMLDHYLNDEVSLVKGFLL